MVLYSLIVLIWYLLLRISSLTLILVCRGYTSLPYLIPSVLRYFLTTRTLHNIMMTTLFKV